MSREQDLLAAFVEFADTFVAEYDVVEFLHRLAARCVELFDAAEAGIMLAGVDGTLAYVASSSERMRLIELFELQHDEGPCMDAYRTGVAVHAGTSGDGATRWPRFAPHAREVGFQSVSALPMRLRDHVIGALNLFSTEAGQLGAEDQQVAQALADVATIGILQERALHDGQIVTSQLQSALESRVVIEQAKGIVAAELPSQRRRSVQPAARVRPKPQLPPQPDGQGSHRRSPHRRGAQPTGGQVAVGEQGSSAPPWMMRSMNWRIASSAGMLSRAGEVDEVRQVGVTALSSFQFGPWWKRLSGAGATVSHPHRATLPRGLGGGENL